MITTLYDGASASEVQNALDFAASGRHGEIILVGSMFFTHEVEIPGNMLIRGIDAQIHANSMIFTTQSSDITLRDIDFVSSSFPLLVTSGSNILMERCTTQGPQDIAFRTSRYCTVNLCDTSNGVSFSGSPDCSYTNNRGTGRFGAVFVSGSHRGYAAGNIVNSTTDFGINVNSASENCIVANNRLFHCDNWSILSDHASYNTLIDGNMVIGGSSAIAALEGRHIVTSNIIRDFDQVGIQLEDVVEAICVANLVDGGGTNGGHHGIFLQGTINGIHRNVIQQNIIRNVTGNTIEIQSEVGSSGNLISGNIEV